MPCSCCESLPASDDLSPGHLYLWPPTAHTTGKIKSLAKKHEYGLEVIADDCLSLALPNGGKKFSVLAVGVLSREELKDTKVIFMQGDAQPGFTDMGRMASLETFIGQLQASWLIDTLNDNRLTTWFHPILNAKDPSRVFAHESLMRGIDDEGTIIPPSHILDVARRADMLFQLDRHARQTAVRRAAEERLESNIFINFTPSSVYDPASCLRTTVATVEEMGIPRERIVFEVIETEEVKDVDHLAGILAFYRQAGFRVALDDLGGGYASLGLLAGLKPNFVKLDRSLITDIDSDSVKPVVVRRIVDMAHDLGIEVVAEGIETQEEFKVVQDLGTDYVQGFLWARPGPHAYRP